VRGHGPGARLLNVPRRTRHAGYGAALVTLALLLALGPGLVASALA